MQTAPLNPFARSDTMFGVCQAIGDDFGFNPLWLRVAFAVAIFFQPVGAVAAYAGLGLLVLATRLLFPNPRVANEAPVEAADSAPAKAEPLPLAA